MIRMGGLADIRVLSAELLSSEFHLDAAFFP